MSDSQPKFNTQVEDPSKPDAPKHEHGLFEAARDKFAAHQANPGPVVPNDLKAPEEGTKAERQARAQELNKEK